MSLHAVVSWTLYMLSHSILRAALEKFMPPLAFKRQSEEHDKKHKGDKKLKTVKHEAGVTEHREQQHGVIDVDDVSVRLQQQGAPQKT